MNWTTGTYDHRPSPRAEQSAPTLLEPSWRAISPTGKALRCAIYQGGACRVEARAPYPRENLIRSEVVSSFDAARTIAGRRDQFDEPRLIAERDDSRCSEARDRTRNRSEWSSEKTTDATKRGYRRISITSIDAMRTVFSTPTTGNTRRRAKPIASPQP
jgi:hypothetical protein